MAEVGLLPRQEWKRGIYLMYWFGHLPGVA